MITTTVRDGVTIVCLDRPQRHNALVPEMAQALATAIRTASQAERPVVLTASGTTFCPGADLKWMAAQPDPAVAVATLVADHHLAVTTLLDARVPVIAAINGPVAGGGLGLALAADLRVADPGATFTAAYLRLGLTPSGGATALLPALIGRARALDLLFSDQSLNARDALAWGLVSEVCDTAGQSVARAIELARGMVAAPGYAVRESRALLESGNIRNQLQLEAVAIRAAARGAWFRDALAKFAAAHPA